jgi:hypothetical protein
MSHSVEDKARDYFAALEHLFGQCMDALSCPLPDPDDSRAQQLVETSQDVLQLLVEAVGRYREELRQEQVIARLMHQDLEPPGVAASQSPPVVPGAPPTHRE